jgi:hypothetical protein
MSSYWKIVLGFCAGNFIWQILRGLISEEADFVKALELSWFQLTLALALWFGGVVKK